MSKRKVTAYIKSSRDYLIKRFGTIKPEWEMPISMLEDTLIRYEQVKDELNKNGLFDISTGKKNPLLSTEKDCIATINKLVQHLGLSPYAAYKIKDTDEDDSDLLKNLMGGD